MPPKSFFIVVDFDPGPFQTECHEKFRRVKEALRRILKEFNTY